MQVRDVFHKKLHISRDIPIARVGRIYHGPEFRGGHRPIQICLVHYKDKEEILRKARLLKGSHIYISEDFSRKVRLLYYSGTVNDIRRELNSLR